MRAGKSRARRIRTYNHRHCSIQACAIPLLRPQKVPQHQYSRKVLISGMRRRNRNYQAHSIRNVNYLHSRARHVLVDRGPAFIFTKCGHLFHAKCIQIWINSTYAEENVDETGKTHILGRYKNCKQVKYSKQFEVERRHGTCVSVNYKKEANADQFCYFVIFVFL